MSKRIFFAIAAAAVLAAAGCGCGDKAATVSLDELQAGFQNPPQKARVQVWWHWMNGNITKDGIRKDLEWFSRIGLGGFHQFDGAGQTPTVVDERLIYMTPGWRDAFKFAVQTADSLGLWMTIASSPGWSATGGPWVEPQDAMKKLVWRVSEVDGGESGVQLPEPFRTTGAYQNGSPAGRGNASETAEYYEDIAVMAVKIPDGQEDIMSLNPKVTSSGGNFTLQALTNGDIADGSVLPVNPRGDFAWIQYEFPKAVTVRSVSVAGLSGGGFNLPNGPSVNALESSDDGKTWNRVCYIYGSSIGEATAGIPETTARFFRLTVRNPEPPRAAGRQTYSFMGMGGPRQTVIDELRLYGCSRVNRSEDKAAFTAMGKLMYAPTAGAAGEAFAQAEDVLDLTSLMDADGHLDWTAPDGRWRVYRFGWSLTGKQNHPAPPEATGLEVDKLDKKAYAKYIHTYYDMYREAAGGLLGERGVQYILTDSYEAEAENWTPAMFEEFESHRGYDLHTWLPVLAGEVIGSPAQSDAFLHDWRRTIGELIAENYAQLTEISRGEYGMKGGYYEAHEAGRAYVVDGMDVKSTASVPMGAMWTKAPWSLNPDGSPNFAVYENDDKESSSVAHIYGQNVAAAESFTSSGGYDAYSFHPGNLKAVADIELANGITRFVVHESAHQPSDSLVPGMSLGGVGQWFNRHETWADMAGTWVDYLSRSSYMLMVGRNVADILFYYGEDSCVQTEIGREGAGIPSGYQWDYCSPKALLEAISLGRGGLMRSVGGTEYRLLWMDRNVDYMSVEVLRKIAELVRGGVVLGGVRPLHPASLTDDEAEFEALVADIWDSGRRNVHETTDIQAGLDAAGIERDAVMPKGFRYLHRDCGRDLQIYWVNKPSDAYMDATVSLRVSGLRPQVWHPETAEVEAVSYRQVGGRTEVDLSLVPDDAVFIVLSGKGQASYAAPDSVENEVSGVTALWTVRFQQGRGAPQGSVTFPALKSYTESNDFGIKYFSGVASYLSYFTLTGTDGQLFVDLGAVENLAEVWVNGEYCGTAWKAPYRVRVTDAVQPGDNAIEVRVANVWPNRLIGDLQPDCPKKVTFTDARHFRADDPLRPAGLLGPVKIIERRP